MKTLIIQDFPLPPSHNQLYRNVPKVGRVTTKEYRDYKKEVEAWTLANRATIDMFRKLCMTEWKSFNIFKFDTFFVFKNERLWTKDGRPKRLDASNRIKATHDCLCTSLDIDDRYIFSGHFEKISGEKEGVVILISPQYPLTALELLSDISDTSPGVGNNH